MREKILGLIRKICNDDTISEEDNFFVVGGDSLKAARLINEVYACYQGKISLEAIFMKPGIKDLINNMVFDYDEQEQHSLSLHQVELDKEIPLSIQQQGIWLHDQIYQSDLFHLIGYMEVVGTIEEVLLEKSIKEALNRYAIFRVSFQETALGEASMKLNEEPEIVIGYEHGISLQVLLDQVNQQIGVQYDRVPLVFYLLKNEQNYHFVIGMHHLLGDEITFQLLVKSIWMHYDSFMKRKDVHAPVEDIYLRFSSWQRKVLNQEKYIQYWEHKLKHLGKQGTIPYSSPKQVLSLEEPRYAQIPFHQEQYDFIKLAGMLCECSVYTIFFGLFKLYLSKITLSEFVHVGFPVSIRSLPQLEDQPGLLVSQTVSTEPVSVGLTLKQFMKNMQVEISQNISHGLLPYEYAVHKLEGMETDSFLPYRIHFNYIVEESEDFVIDGLSFKPLSFMKLRQLSEFELVVGSFDEQYKVGFVYKESFLDAEIALKMAEDFQSFVRQLDLESLSARIQDLLAGQEEDAYGDFEF